MSLFAPVAVSVQIGTDDRRVFRLSHSVAETGLILERPAPFEIGRPVTVMFTLPDALATEPLKLRAVVALTDSDGEGADGGCALDFVDPQREDRQAIHQYVAGRLGLPGGGR